MLTLRCAKQNELDCEHSKLEELQRELERKLLEVEGETHIQQDQLLADFEQVNLTCAVALHFMPYTLKLCFILLSDSEAARPPAPVENSATYLLSAL